jgi:hypothetical protein
MYKALDSICEEVKGKCPVDMDESPCPFVHERKGKFLCSLIQLINRKMFAAHKESQ